MVTQRRKHFKNHSDVMFDRQNDFIFFLLSVQDDRNIEGILSIWLKAKFDQQLQMTFDPLVCVW